MATHPEALPPMAKKPRAVPRPPWGRTWNWIVILTTIILLAGSLGGYYYDRKQKEALAAPYLRLVVTGPAALEAGTATEYSIATSTISGEPLPSSIQWSLRSPDGKRLIDRKDTADESGALRVTIPADMALPSRVELDVTAAHGGQHEEAKSLLAVQSPQYATQLTLDRPSYRPGEPVYYRLLSLSRRGLLADRAMPIHFEVLDPSGAVAPGSRLEGLTDRGVGQGVFVAAGQLPEGTYTLVARSMDGAFAEQKQSFFIGRRPAAAGSASKKLAVAFYPEGGAGRGAGKPRLFQRPRLTGQPGGYQRHGGRRPQSGHRRGGDRAGRHGLVQLPAQRGAIVSLADLQPEGHPPAVPLA